MIKLSLVLGALVLAPVLCVSSAQAQPLPAWQRVDAVKALVAGKVEQGQILTIDLPLVSEDGSSVPLTLMADKPLADGVFIQHIDIFAPANPTAEVASFELGPELSPLSLSLRVRLSESQTVVVVARTSDGRTFVTERPIRITTSGCIATTGGADVANEMNERVRLPKKFVAGQPAEIVTLITHPMVTGLVADAQGNMPEQRIINHFDVSIDNNPVLKARFYRSMAANPYVRFKLAPEKGTDLLLAWTEDTGRTTEYKADIGLGPN